MSSNFQFNSKSVFLTFPQCDYPLDQFREKIEAFFHGNLERGVISQEKHQDGNYHLHAAICLLRPHRSREVEVFDTLVEPPKHPNIAGRFTGGLLKAFQYVMKEGNFLALNEPEFNLQSFMESATKKKSTRSQLIVRELMEPGADIEEVFINHADFMLLNLNKAQSFVNFLDLRNKRLQFAAVRHLTVHVQPAAMYWQSWNVEIASWLNQNLRKIRAHRQTQLWIVSRPRMGKTSMMLLLEKTFKLKVYYVPKGEKWYDGYAEDTYDCMVFDEFFADKPITEMNQLLSGDPMPLSRRGMPPVLKRNILPVIILSNYSPHECYKTVADRAPHKLDALLDRIKVVDALGPIRLEAVPPDVETPPTVDPDMEPPYYDGPEIPERTWSPGCTPPSTPPLPPSLGSSQGFELEEVASSQETISPSDQEWIDGVMDDPPRSEAQRIALEKYRQSRPTHDVSWSHPSRPKFNNQFRF